MPRFTHSQHGFNGGELAPEIHGRRDLEKYVMGANTIENFIVTPEGGLHRRPGTQYVTNASGRLVPFDYTGSDSYMLLFGDGQIEVFKGTAQVNITDRTFDGSDLANLNLNSHEIYVKDHGYSHGQSVTLTTTGTVPQDLSTGLTYTVSLPGEVSGDSTAITTTSPGVFTADASFEWEDSMGPFRFSNTGTLPTSSPQINADTYYYVHNVNTIAGTFSLAEDAAGTTPINVSVAGTGTWTLRPTNDYRRDYLRLYIGGVVETLTLPGTGDTTITPVTTQGTVIPSPYSSAEVDELQFAQSNDFLFIAHKDHRPAQLTRTSDTQWAFDDVDFIDGPYLDENVIDTDTITTTARSLGDRTSLTLSDAAIINDGDGWKSTDIGRIVRFKSTGGSNDIPGYVEIDDIQSPTVAAGKILQQVYGAVGAKYKWRLGAWYQGNYPRAVSFAEQRLCFGGEPDAPNFITTSNTGKFNVMRPTALNHEATVEDTHSLRVAIADNHLQTVLWLSNARTLLAGSESAVFAIRASVDGEAFAPTNINAVKVAAIGSDAVQPVSVADRVVFPTRNGQGLRGMVADSQDAENSVPDDVAILARHVFGRIERIEEIAYQFDRRSVVWMVRSDGVLLGCTYVPEQQVFAWHQHKLGGSFDGGDAVVESVGVAQAGGTGHDRVWLVVKRTVGSTTVRHVEFFEDEWTDGVATSQRYVDSHPAAYSGAATTQFGGFAHLVGETVQVLGDGAVLEDAVVEEAPAGYGRIVTDREYTDLVAGYGYTSTFESLPLEIPDQRGTSMGKAKRADHVVLRLWDSHTGEVATIGWDGEPRSWSPVIQRGAGDVHGSPVAPFTGDKSVNVEGESTMDLRIRIRQTQPVAFNLLAMTVEGEIGGN